MQNRLPVSHSSINTTIWEYLLGTHLARYFCAKILGSEQKEWCDGWKKANHITVEAMCLSKRVDGPQGALHHHLEEPHPT